ncbi:MAG: hypothetical protein ACOWWH_09745 [Eubacteriaceae bacterium]
MSKDTRKRIKKILMNFSQPKDSLVSGISSDFYKHYVLKSYERWRLARFLFDEILNFEIADRPIEKVNWEIPFIYKKRYHCSIAHQKFGFRVYVANEDTKNPKTVAEEVAEIIEKGIEYSEPIIRKYAIDSLKIGDINADNRLRELKEVYEYFRDEVSKRKRKIESISKAKGKNKYFQEQFKLEKEISYLEQAGYVAFFSLLEHLCILVLAFRDIPERKNVKEFAQKSWQDKFKIVFDLSQKEFKENYDYLLGISRYKRNPSVHGLFDKLHTIFYFYLPSARHRVSVGLYDKEILLRWRNEKLSFEKLDAFLELLSKHESTKRIWRYIMDAGLNVTFGKDAENLDVFSFDEEFEEYLKYLVYQYDNMANMDW